MLWILASVATALLFYEIWTLLFSVLGPLLANAVALQTDFHYYYEAAVRYSADHSRLYLASDDVIAGFTYPPPAIVPFLILSRLPLGVALALMTAASYAALIASARIWRTSLQQDGVVIDWSTRVALLVIVVASGPAYMNAIFGQVNAFVLLAAVLFVTNAAQSPAIAGVGLAAGAWLKIYPGFLVLIGAWDAKAWRAIVYAALAAVAIAIVLLPVIPAAAYASFIELLPRRAGITAIHISNQSLVAFVERFNYAPELFLNWTGQQAVAVTTSTRAIQLVVAIALVAALWLRVWQSSAVDPAVAASTMALVAVTAPLGWGHTYVMALPLVMLQLVRMRKAPRAVAVVIFAAVAAMLIPAGRHLPIDGIPAWLQNVVYSRYLIATIALIVISTVSRVPLSSSARVASA